MKRAIFITGIVLSFVAGCLIDDPTIDTDEKAAIITSPDEEANLGGGGCLPEEAERGMCGDGGGGGGNCTPGTEGCSGPVDCGPGRRYNWTLHMCVVTNHMQSCTGGYNPWPGGVCRIDIHGVCSCNPPPCSVFDPCPPPPF